MAHVVHVHQVWGLAEKMIVNGGDFKSRRAEFFQDRIDFGIKQDQVSHHRRVFVSPRKSGPRPESQPGFHGDSLNDNLQVRARETHSVDFSSLLARTA